MNNWNPVESQLRTWKPRSPSPRLKARLFPEAEAARTESPSAFGGRWGWLAPVMGCCLALLVVSNSRNPQFGSWSASGPTNWMAAVASNQSYAAYIVASFHSEQNSLQGEPIEWMKAAGERPEPNSVGQLATNRLKDY